MKSYLEFHELTYDGIGDFIESADQQDAISPLYLFGKAAAYVDMAYALDRITRTEALELRTCIAVYAACNTP